MLRSLREIRLDTGNEGLVPEVGDEGGLEGTLLGGRLDSRVSGKKKVERILLLFVWKE